VLRTDYLNPQRGRRVGGGVKGRIQNIGDPENNEQEKKSRRSPQKDSSLKKGVHRRGGGKKSFI